MAGRRTSRLAGDPVQPPIPARRRRGIENRLHYVRDETLGEDRCRVRSRAAPQLLAAIRNAVVYLRDTVDAATKVAATRCFSARPDKALPLIFT